MAIDWCFCEAVGGVYTWGRNLFGRSGIGGVQDGFVPTYVSVGTNLDDGDGSRSSHSSGREGNFHSLHVRDRDRVNRPPKVVQVAAGANHNLALTADGVVWSWGYNAYGQLGREKDASHPSSVTFTCRTTAEDGRRGAAMRLKRGTTDQERKRPKKLVQIIAVEAGGMISCAIDLDGALWLWGAVPNPSDCSGSRSSGNGSFSVIRVERPEKVRGLLGLRVYRVAVGNEHIVALVEGRDDSDLDCYAWGNNQFGQLGLGDFRDREYPQVVKALSASVIGSIVDLACGAFHTAILAVKEDHPANLILEPNSPRCRRNKQGWDVSQDISTPRHSFFRTHQPMAEELESIRNSPNVRMRQDSETSSSLRSTAWGSSRMSSSRNFTQCTSTRSKESFCLEGRLSVCWTFGQGESGQLGQGTSSNQYFPAPVEGLPNERLRTVACGLFHTSVVTETDDVWVWGMEGGLGLCPGIGPPGTKTGDAFSPVRVFGDSSASCHPVMGSKGITCGAAHTVTISNGGRDIWAWGRGQSGVLGSGHTSDSWFPCPVIWPPAASASWSGGAKVPSQSDTLFPIDFDCRRSSRASSWTGSRDRADSIKSSPKVTVMVDTRKTGGQPSENSAVLDEIKSIQKELAEVRRYAESLHAAIYGEAEYFYQQPGNLFHSDRNSDYDQSSDQGQGSGGALRKEKALQEWEHRMEAASDANLANLDRFYRGMRIRLKEVLFERKSSEWCHHYMSAMDSSATPVDPQPMREPYSADCTPSMNGPGMLAMLKTGLYNDRAEMLPPAASVAEFCMLARQQR
ncbi:uncharacterized protein [Physcomitrium patens]|uniref:uncharacterized protein isoform X3 n=1 Tax=Physcomitrium patens TaxID=3218 RepID=UPI000D175B72|nr:probable E3 ubiquitin-protein ligase HERC1 isoform X3 [Physcomitrium patens]|eukprot:XP_024369205.1 probable E3 ubiquitin-protein ligase HERC1 isoform X3 [Physcomitrella patens]